MLDRYAKAILDEAFQPMQPVHTAPMKTMYFCLPITSSHSLQIRMQILCSAAFHILI